MIIAALLVLVALGLAVFGGRVPHALCRTRWAPATILTSWLALVVGSLVAVLCAAVLVVLPTHSPAHHLMRMLYPGLVDRVHGLLSSHGDLVTAGLVVVATVLTGRVMVAMIRQALARRRVHRRQVELLRVVARAEPGVFPTMWLAHPSSVAYSVAGNPALVVATDGLAAALSEAMVAAVIEHERAHLRGRHHVLVGIAEGLAAALPWSAFARRSLDLVRLQVELAADRAAAGRHGADTVRAALLALAGAGPAGAPAGLACDWVETRLDRLARPVSRWSLGRFVVLPLAGVGWGALPVVVGLALVTLPSAVLG